MTLSSAVLLILAYNGLNPITAVDAAVDFMILYQLYNNIRETFGITEEIIASSKKVSDKDKRLVLGGMSREGINLILKNAGRQLVARTFLKVVPVVGQATAALIGYKLVSKTAVIMSMPVMNLPERAAVGP